MFVSSGGVCLALFKPTPNFSSICTYLRVTNKPAQDHKADVQNYRTIPVRANKPGAGCAGMAGSDQ
jgi:hypothetical protein